MLHAVTVRAVKLRERDEGMRCDRLHGIGFAWRCTCGKRGPIEGAFPKARSGGRDHVAASASAD